MNIRRQNGNFQFQEDPSGKNDKSIRKYYHEVLLLKKLLQTKPQVKTMIIIYYDLYYTANKNGDDNEFVNDTKKIMKMNIIIFMTFLLLSILWDEKILMKI